MTLPCQALLLLLGTASSVSAERIDFGDVSGEITALPGLGWMNRGLDFKMYSGYVDVGKNGKTFFWFVESQTPDSASDPVLLWTNGGPGCSGLVGFMTEQGPFRPMPDGSLALNEYSWNTVANMVFIEQPVGVGFSVAADGEIKYGDAQAAQDNYNFVVGFFEKFKMLSKNKFFISSESCEFAGRPPPAPSHLVTPRRSCRCSRRWPLHADTGIRAGQGWWRPEFRWLHGGQSFNLYAVPRLWRV
jgi:hypothetical protein